jgi:DNA-binding NarL/FixJ family response regulator
MPEQALTAREHEVLTLMARGLSVTETARHLGVTAQTVKNHRASIFKKLGARNGIEAVFLGLRRGMIDGAHRAEGACHGTDPAA